MRTPSAFLTAVIACIALVAPAAGQQLQLQLLMNPNPSRYLSDWEKKQETATLLITNPGAPMGAKLSAKISLDDALQAKTNVRKTPLLQIPSGVSSFDASQILPFSSVDFFGEARNTAARTGMLPAGTYELCVELLDADNGNTLSQPACAHFRLVSTQAPVCLQPQDGSTLRSGMPIFRWTPVSPPPQQPVQYTVQVFEVLHGQSPTQAFRSNRPILSEDVVGVTQLIWPQSVQLPDSGTLVWSVQAKDENGNRVGGRDGWAEPVTFSLIPPSGILTAAGGGAVFTNDPCADSEGDVKKKKDELQKLKDALEGIDREIAKAKKAIRDCLEELEAARKALEAAKAALQKQKNIHHNITKDVGPGKKFPNKEAAEAEYGDYDGALKSAEDAVAAAEAKVKELEKRCPEKTKALDRLKDRKSTLPEDVTKAEKAVGDAETVRDECVKKKDQCKEGELRDAPVQTTAPKTYLCAVSGCMYNVKTSTNLDRALAAAKGFGEYLEKGLKIIEKTVSVIPGAKGLVKLIKIPADLGAKIARAIGESGMFARLGLEWVTVEITIGPLHKYTLKMTDLEICRDGKWVPHDKKKCELIDEGEVPSTTISHTWKTGGPGDTDLTELTEAGTGFTKKLAEAIQKLLDDAITSPEKLDEDRKNCL